MKKKKYIIKGQIGFGQYPDLNPQPKIDHTWSGVTPPPLMDYSGDLNSLGIQQKGIMDALSQSLKYPNQPQYGWEGTGQYDFHPYFKVLNSLAQGVTGVANKVSDVRNTRREYEIMLKALQNPDWENMQEDGLNDLPIYTQNGGEIEMPYGGGPLTAEGAKEMLRDGRARGKKLTAKQKRYFGYIAGGGKPKKQVGGNVNKYNVEAEEGEVFQNDEGTIDKVPEGANTHEEGGVMIPDANRVLEDTSDKRNDADSKALQLNPDLVSLLVDVDTTRPLSHSKAFEKGKEKIVKDVNKVQRFLKKNLESVKQAPSNKYAHNSMDLNMAHLSTIPTEGEIFDDLFDHQEFIKAATGIQQNQKAKYGGKYKAQYGTYPGGKTPLGRKTPTNKINNFQFEGGLDAYKAKWKEFGLDLSQYSNAKDAQRATYEYLVKNNPDIVKNMWSDAGLTNQGRANAAKIQALGIKLKPNPANPSVGLDFEDVNSLTPEQLSSLNDLAYADNMLGYRTFVPAQSQTVENNTTPGIPAIPAPTTINPLNINLRNNPKSRFNEPLRWFDVAGPIQDLIGAQSRIPTKYNPIEFNQLRLKKQNPLPSLQRGQTDYNSLLKTLPDNTVGMSNAGDIFSKKYGIDNQILGQYENINSGIENQEIMYNTQVKDRQSAADAQSREAFEQKYLGSKEAQRQQLHASWNDLYTRIAQNRKLNREGNLLMKLFPAFDQYGEYNGYQIPLKYTGVGTNGIEPVTTKKITEQKTITVGGKTYQIKGK